MGQHCQVCQWEELSHQDHDISDKLFTMGILGLTWDPAFLRTRAGMTMAVESGVGVLGAVISIVLGNGFESFLYWSTFFISGMFLFTHVTSLTQVLEAKIPSIAKILLGYLAAWSVMLAIACIYRFIFWNFISYRSSPSTTAGPGPATPAAAEAGGKY